MRYELGPLRQPMGRTTVEFEAEAPEGTGATIAAPIRGRLDLSRTNGDVSVRGRLWVTLQLDCARCLGAFEEVLELEVNEDCALRQIDDPESYAIGEDDLCQIPILNGEELDLSELVRQLIAMNLPLRPLCREDCPGLCLRCGKDLSEGPCNCKEPEIDPRWAGLKGLKLE